MAPEIADSDAESDFHSPVKQMVATGNVDGGVDPSQVSLSRYDFDQFLDPTQRLSSISPSHVNSAPTASELLAGLPSDSSDALMGKRSSEPSSITQGKKRARSDLENGSRRSQHDGSAHVSSSKRTKTYAHSSKSRGSLQDIDLFSPSGEPPIVASTNTQNIPVQSANGLSQNLFNSLPNTGPAINLLDHPLSNSTHRLTTSTASMGQYESINLDFRGTNQGLDIHANPFGSLSQASMGAEGDINATMLHTDAQQTMTQQHPIPSISTDELLPHQTLSALFQSSPTRPSFVDPSVIMQHDGPVADPAAIDDFRTGTALTTILEQAEPVETVAEKPQAKKRGRKPKNSRVPSESPVPGALDDMDDFALPDLPSVARTRQGTVDSVSQASETSATNLSSKNRKRGKSKQVVEEAGQEAPAEESPVKHPTSELHLSDEAMIGLPKEKYKPRPSRSRSKKVDEEEAFPVHETEQQTPARNTTVDFEEPAEKTPASASAKSGTKKGRKSKVKRAKTSAAALLKKAEPMLSEGEEDVVWMDTKPTPVKLDLPPDLSVLKKETEMTEDNKSIETKGAQVINTSAKETDSIVTVEIPTEAKGSVVGPKKRGRKPKKVQPLPQPEVAEDEEEGPDDIRPVLAEKTTNISIDIRQDTNYKEPKAPTMSPLSEAPSLPASPEKGKVVQAAVVITPSKDSTADKGSTTHSPIKPSGLSSGQKTTYRVGLSRRQNIPSLLRRVQRDKAPPKIVVRKEKENKKKKDVDNGSDDDTGADKSEMRGADGMLVEWDF
ncbi:hypothetical protein PV11_03295 [Exophiala sideris]|uniref:Uncharacterized protein n=1 Tax=Exophiala sideris TaxID=1016849 RepID=A0A0D1ZLT8_9EURO|nr:hypothetical protein PV11_03295 [Exophiala sideris]